jgi:chitinase
MNLKPWLPLLVVNSAIATASASMLTNVSIVDFSFEPPSVTIHVNDQVKWRWDASNHSTTANAGLWDSGLQHQFFTYTHTFTAVGSYPYHCSAHLFSGSIIVTNAAPSVAFTNPPDGAVFAAPASFVLKATAADTDGTVTNVQFLRGSSSIGNDALAPYTRPITNINAGDFTFSAVATDSDGVKATNSIVLHIVTPGPIRLTYPLRTSPTSFQFACTTTAGLGYIVQRSPDLSTWTNLGSTQATITSTVFVDDSATNRTAFYRVQLRPNP